jgi:ubiquinone/menaquinone biosynthesis C-methylase UbiE
VARGRPVFAAFYNLIERIDERAGMAERRHDLLAHAYGRVVEIGAGTGLNFSHYPPSVTKVEATEPDPYMRRRARRAAATAPVPVTVTDAAAEALPFQDGSFDAAAATLVLCSVRDPDVALHELRRVLKPGGRLLFFEHVRGADRLARWQDRLERPWGWFAGGCHPNRDTVQGIREAGFELEELEEFDFNPGLVLVRPHASGAASRPVDGH